LASAGVTAAKAKIIAEHLIIARIFAPKLEGRFEPQSTKLAMMTSESIPFERSRSTGPIAQNRCHRPGDCTQHAAARPSWTHAPARARENIEEFPPKYALAGVERSTESETLPAVAIGNWLGG
jgi:hypothetical protein